MRISIIRLWLTFSAVLAFAPTTIFATNGYFSHGYSIKSKGLAGAGVALPMDAMDAALNPANMVMVGDRMDLGLTVFSPQRSYTVTGAPTGAPGTFGLFPTTVDSQNEAFFIPNFARNWMLNQDSSIGVTVYGNGGMNTEWQATDVDPAGRGTYGAGTAGVDYMELFINTTYSRKFSNTASWGISGIAAYRRFEATGISSFAGVSNDSTKLSNNGHDGNWGFGAKLGFQAEISSNVAVGASYQSKIYMGSFDKYSGLFAEQGGGFDLPATATIGLTIKPSAKTALLFDVQRIWYGDVPSISNPMMPNFGICATRTTPTNPNCLGGNSGIGFGWQDITTFKLGFQLQPNNDWTWRLGYSTGDQPIPSSEVMFNILAPGIMEQHFTFGFSKKVGKDSTIDMAFMYAPSNTVTGPNPLEAPGAQQIELEMKQYEVSINWSKSF